MIGPHTQRIAAVAALWLAAVAPVGAAPERAASSPVAAAAAVSAPALPGADALAAIDAAARAAAADPVGASTRLAALVGDGSEAQRALAEWMLDGVRLRRHDAAGSLAAATRLVAGAGGLRVAGLMIRARQARDAGALDVAGREALAAHELLEQQLADGRVDVLQDSLRVELLRLLGEVEGAAGRLDDGLRRLQTAQRLAEALHDAGRAALALDAAAGLLADLGDEPRAAVAEAGAWQRAVAAQPADAALLARLQLGRAARALQAGRLDAALDAAQAAVQQAEGEHAGALAAEALALRAQAQRLGGQLAAARRSAGAAVAAAQAAELLPGAREQRLARAQLGLARIAAGEIAPGRQQVEQALRGDDGGDDALAAALLRQLDRALAAAGEPRAALEVFHRERALREARLARERSVVLRELEARYDSARQQRELDALERSNALKAAALEQQALQQRALGLAALVVALALGTLVLWFRRARATRRQLADRQVQLRLLSERDPLTQLANRRHFRQLMQERRLDAAYEGALLLLDIDRFKRINDRHGHAAGDAVLVEVARRLGQTVRADDLLVRWGGEEFLLAAPGLPAERLPLLAERLLQAVGSAPIDTPAGPIPVTASIGHASFPLAGAPVLGWERGLGLVDAALYQAKRQGRNQALGLAQLQAADDAALRAVEADLLAAVRAGRVTVRRVLGPTQDAAATAALAQAS